MSLLNIRVTLIAFLSVTSCTCTVYNVTPDDVKCGHCRNLQDYFLNVTNYFASNVRLHFLPGLHHLHTDLTIQNAHNFTLIGSTANGTVTPQTVIHCAPLTGIIITNSTNLMIKNMVIKNCINKHDLEQAAVFIKECSFIKLHFVQIYHNKEVISLFFVNVLGVLSLHKIKCHSMYFHYNETITKARQHSVVIDHYDPANVFSEEYGIYLYMSQHSYKIILQVANSTIQQLKRFVFLNATSNMLANQNTVIIINCQFYDNNYKTIRYLFYFYNVNVNFDDCQFHENRNHKIFGLIKIMHGNNVTLFNCKHNILHKSRVLIEIYYVSNIAIKHSFFYGNKHTVLYTLNTTMVIENTTFSTITTASVCTICLRNTNLLFNGPVNFYKNKNKFAGIIEIFYSIITVHGYIQFSMNSAFSMIAFSCESIHCFMMKVLDNTIINITNNTLFTYFTDFTAFGLVKVVQDTYQQCFFQYFSTRNLDYSLDAGNFSIIVKFNRFDNLSLFHRVMHFPDLLGSEYNLFAAIPYNKLYNFATITHCYWLPQSAFNTTIPLNVNKQYIKYTNNSELLYLSRKKTLCYCTDEKKYDCFKNELDSLYPGQTLIASFYTNEDTEIVNKLDQSYITSCTVINAKENIQFIGKRCSKVNYTIAFPVNDWCELFLSSPRPRAYNEFDVYYIRELPCPLGFVKIDGICQCYPSFKQFGFSDCDINTQAIFRPRRGWILLNTHIQENDSYSCYISRLCPYDYCKPYTFYLNFSTPDAQCQFERSGFLCGKCQQGLSTVFSSHHCQGCSNVYLLLIIPIAVAGAMLVLLLFLFNLTVTDGIINAFTFYANVININSIMFFPNHHGTFPLHTIISLANLDLGIQTCFYNGMDDYAKVWLQLAFPFYIISIAILIIVVSRYSITLQRLTVQRAHSILATLFLLSYTNILHTTSSVLFSYSSISHLPSEHTMLVWSLDANVPLFGVKFTLLFVICLILFVLLVLFSVILLCAKVFIKYKLFGNFLDSFQRPYKLYYWFGLQLVMRMVFFYMSFLDRKVNITVSIIILNIAIAVQGTNKPFKKKLQNYNEMLLMINILGLYLFVLSQWWIVNYALISVAGIQFSLIITHHIMNQFCGRIIRKTFFQWRSKHL